MFLRDGAVRKVDAHSVELSGPFCSMLLLNDVYWYLEYFLESLFTFEIGYPFRFPSFPQYVRVCSHNMLFPPSSRADGRSIRWYAENVLVQVYPKMELHRKCGIWFIIWPTCEGLRQPNGKFCSSQARRRVHRLGAAKSWVSAFGAHHPCRTGPGHINCGELIVGTHEGLQNDLIVIVNVWGWFSFYQASP